MPIVPALPTDQNAGTSPSKVLSAPESTSPDKVQNDTERPRQLTLSHPVGLRASDEQLLDALLAAVAVRGNRKQLRRPQPPKRMAYRQARGNDAGSAYWRTRRHLAKLALRALNDLHAAGFEIPDEAQLADALLEYVWARLRSLISTRAPGEPSQGKGERYAWLTGKAPERVAADTARSVLDSWDPDWIEERRESGRRGGKKSKRGPSWSAEDLTVLSLILDWSIPEQADALNVSERTVSRMRAVLASEPVPKVRPPLAPISEPSWEDLLLSGEPMPWPNPAKWNPDTPRDSARTRQREALHRRYENADRRRALNAQWKRELAERKQFEIEFEESIRNPTNRPEITFTLEELLA